MLDEETTLPSYTEPHPPPHSILPSYAQVLEEKRLEENEIQEEGETTNENGCRHQLCIIAFKGVVATCMFIATIVLLRVIFSSNRDE